MFRKNFKARAFVLCLMLVSFLLAGSPPAGAEDAVARLKRKITNLLEQDKQLKGCQIGIYARAIGGRVVYARDADTPMIPASNLKVLTTAAALAYLGPDFRFRTEVLGPPADAQTGIIRGNVFLRGNGDPTFVEPWTRPATGPLLDFAECLHHRGVRIIQGDLVGDDSAFDREFLGRGWQKRYLLMDYAPETGALSINGNVMHLQVKPDGVTAYPPTDKSALRVRRISSRGGASVTRQYNSNCLVVQNVKDKPVQASMTLHNPPLYTTSTFASVLRDSGIRLQGGTRLVAENELPLKGGLITYGTHESAPLLKILTQINKHSDNLFAQHVFKAVGWKVKGKGTVDNSFAAVREFMASLGVDTQGLQMADGCGLSVLNQVTPRQFVELLDGITRRPYGRLFKSTLSVAGKDGTLRGRLTTFNVRGKTGTIDGTCTLSGYVMTKAGQEVAFSILCNHYHTSNDYMRVLQDEIVKAIALFPERLQ